MSLSPLQIERPEDFLVLRIEFANMELQAGGTRLVRGREPGDATITLIHQPQHFVENTSGQNPAPKPPVLASGSSSIRFLVPMSFSGCDYTVAAILQTCADLTPMSSEINLPAPLLLLPQIPRPDIATWSHAPLPYRSPTTGRVELWHTRLGVRHYPYYRDADETTLMDSLATPSARLGAYSYLYPPSLKPAPADIEKRMRGVASNSQLRPLHIRKMMLSALGGWLDAYGDWSNEPRMTSQDQAVLYWEQRATMGRDQYSKTAEVGYLLPFGHRVVKTDIYWRVGNSDQAELVATTGIKVVNPLQEYGGLPADPMLANKWRQLPFRSIELSQAELTDLDPDTSSWLKTKRGDLVMMQMRGIDLCGKVIDFQTPVFFVSKPMDEQLDTFNKVARAQRIPMSGQRIAFAPADKNPTPGSAASATTFETLDLTFGTCLYPSGASSKVLPYVQDATLYVEALRHIAGVTSATRCQYYPGYANSGFPLPSDVDQSNKGEVLFQLMEPVQTSFRTQSDRSGGFLAPDMIIQGLSRKLGTVAVAGAAALSQPTDPALPPQLDPLVTMQLGKVAGGAFDPAQFFPDARLFGVFSLKDLIDKASTELKFAPQLITESLSAVESLVANLKALTLVCEQLEQRAAAVANPQLVAQAKTLTGKLNQVLSDLLPAGWGNLPAHLTELEQAASTLVTALASTGTTIATNATALVGKIPALLRTLGNIISDIASATVPPQLVSHIGAASSALKDLLAAVNVDAAVSAGVRQLIKRQLGEVAMFLDPGAAQGAAQRAAQLVDVLQKWQRGVELAKNLAARLEWRPMLKQLGDAFVFRPRNPQGLLLSVLIRAKATDRQPAGAEVLCSLEDFDLLMGAKGDDAYVTVQFKKLVFHTVPGKKPDLDVDFSDIKFGRELSFVQTLRSLIPLDGFSDPPWLDYDASGIKAGYSIALPNIALGIFSLEDLKLSAMLKLPFIGEAPSLSFDFCSHANPFHLSVSLFGGGGWFNFKLSPKEIDVQAGLEFGAYLSMDFGVASGSVSVAAGIYFEMEGSVVKIHGYLRIRGQVDVLHLISLSIELRMELEYDVSSHKVIGRATLTVEIDLFFFSKSVDITVERRFAGSNGDPTFADTVKQDKWIEYCGAFA